MEIESVNGDSNGIFFDNKNESNQFDVTDLTIDNTRKGNSFVKRNV